MPCAPFTATQLYGPFPANYCSATAWYLLLRNYWFPVRIVLTHKKCVGYKAARMASYETIWFTEGLPARKFGRSQQERLSVFTQHHKEEAE